MFSVVTVRPSEERMDDEEEGKDDVSKRWFKLKADVNVEVYDGFLSALELRYRQKQHLRDADSVDSRWVCCAWPCCDRWNVHWARMSGVAVTRGVLGYEYDAPNRDDANDSYFGVHDGRDDAADLWRRGFRRSFAAAVGLGAVCTALGLAAAGSYTNGWVVWLAICCWCSISCCCGFFLSGFLSHFDDEVKSQSVSLTMIAVMGSGAALISFGIIAFGATSAFWVVLFSLSSCCCVSWLTRLFVTKLRTDIRDEKEKNEKTYETRDCMNWMNVMAFCSVAITLSLVVFGGNDTAWTAWFVVMLVASCFCVAAMPSPASWRSPCRS